ncbi:MAG: hypothetical protein HZC54_06665 [Verrucomicrobia bacterium]|nr:hypothetical protein [Verrucomicrobiota bacterium]
MKSLTCKTQTTVLGFMCAGLLVLCAWLAWDYSSQKLHIAFAEDQIQIFSAMRTKALQSDAPEAASSLEYVVLYYPSGSKQEKDSRLDAMVERERARVIKEIIAYLCTKTGEDLGTSPDAWIRKYAKR